jgi:trehalose 6-phosphate phosphatase
MEFSSDTPVSAAGMHGPPPGVFPAGQVCLFLDFDGTLIELVDDPRDVRPDVQLLRILSSLQVALGGAIALISGRRLEELDTLLHPLKLPAAGLHGLERRDARGRLRLRAPTSARADLCRLRARLRELVAANTGLLLEDKGASLAVHYRRAPELQETVRRAVAALVAALAPKLELLQGDMVLEIKPHGLDKATAVDGFMREEPFAGRVPVFVGDDLTDCDGFGAARRHAGMTVAVGDRVTAQWHLPDPAAVRVWLARIVEAGRQRGT